MYPTYFLLNVNDTCFSMRVSCFAFFILLLLQKIIDVFIVIIIIFVDDLLYLVCPGEVIQPFVLSGLVLMVRTHHKEVAVSSIGAIASIFRGEEIRILGLFFLTKLPENLLEMVFLHLMKESLVGVEAGLSPFIKKRKRKRKFSNRIFNLCAFCAPQFYLFF